MRILVIGGTGFIGPAVVRHLQRLGHAITVFHRGHRPAVDPAVHQILGDRQHLADYAEAFRQLSPDVVVDLILSSGRQAQELMRVFKGIAGRVVAISSMDVYRACGVLHGSEPGPLEPVPLTEDSPLRTHPQTYPPEALARMRRLFAWVDDAYDKIPVEQAVRAEPALPGTVLRLPMVYRPGDPLHRLFPILKRSDDGRPAILLEETVAQWRGPRGYVGNVAAAIALAATSERAAGQVYNVAEPDHFSELEWTQRVAQAVGWKGRVLVAPAERAPAHLKVPANLQQHWTADSRRIRQQLGYSEPVALADALQAAIAWERANPPEVDPRPFDYAAEDVYLNSVTGV